MRVVSKLGLGWGLLILVFLGILAYDLAVVRRLARVNQGLSDVEFRATTLSLEQSRRLAAMEEFARKLVVTRDPAYADRLAELAAGFGEGLAELRLLELSERETAEVERLTAMWSQLPVTGIAVEAMRLERGGEAERELLDVLVASFTGLREQATTVLGATQEAIAAKVAAALDAGGQAQTLSWIFVALALVLSAGVLWLTIRSLDRPLTRLTRGVRAVSDGQFSFHLGPSRGDEFSVLEGSFNEMVRRLGELDRAKSDFLSHVSHVLKTPVVAAQETNRLLLEEIPGPLNNRQRRLLELNLESSHRLSAMISKLLELSRLEAAVVEYDLRQHDLGETVSAAAGGFEALARERGMRLRVQTPGRPVVAVFDRDRVIQVTENLLENAIKFSPSGETIEVRVLPVQPGAGGDDARAVVEVADRGPGIPEQLRDRVFERFYQVDPGAHGGEQRGVGLGLAICREIVRAHRGEVWLRDHEGGGSTFAFCLPVARTADHPPHQAAKDQFRQ